MLGRWYIKVVCSTEHMAQHSALLKDPKENIITFGAADAEICSVLPANGFRVSTPSMCFSIVGYGHQWVEL